MDWEPSYCSLLSDSTSLLWSINRESTLGWCDQLSVRALSYRLKLVMRLDRQKSGIHQNTYRKRLMEKELS